MWLEVHLSEEKRRGEKTIENGRPNGPNVSFPFPFQLTVSRCELQQPTKPTAQLFFSIPAAVSLSLCGRTAISWPFRLLCFRSSLKIQMTSRPHLPFPSLLPSIGLSTAADSITSFSSLKKQLALSPLLSSRRHPRFIWTRFYTVATSRPHAGKVKLKNWPHSSVRRVGVRTGWFTVPIDRGFLCEVNWRLRETRVTSRQGRQTVLSFLCDKIL